MKLLITATLLFIFATVSCTPVEVKEPLDQVTVQLKWVHQAQFAGFYVAREKGYYEQEKLEVNFLEGGEGIDNVESLTSGQAHFIVDSPEATLTYNGAQRPIAIAAIYRRSPLVFIALAESGIHKPADFLGQTVAIEGSALDVEIQFVAMMEKLGLAVDEVVLMPYDYEYATFLNRDAKITYGYLTGGVTRLRHKGHQLNLIWPCDYGIHMYSDTLFTTEQLIAENPDLVTRFLRATLKGWQDAVGDAGMAVEMTMRYAKEANPDLQLAMMEAQLPLVHTGEEHIGWMKREMWQGMYKTLLEQGLAPANLDWDKLYTLQFLEQIYWGEVK